MPRQIKKKENKKDKGNKVIKNFIAFGNRKKVFWSIASATIILTLISFPIILKNENVLKSFLIIWILEAIYILLYLGFKRRKNSISN